jgi:hypothetical protein
MKYLTATEARAFAERWLPASSGNDPERLASLYSHDAFYLDPGVPDGVRGNTALLEYFRKLLGYDPNWVWTQIEGIPLEDGFLNKWLARIPVGLKTLEIVGVLFSAKTSRRQIPSVLGLHSKESHALRPSDKRVLMMQTSQLVLRGRTRPPSASGGILTSAMSLPALADRARPDQRTVRTSPVVMSHPLVENPP